MRFSCCSSGPNGQACTVSESHVTSTAFWSDLSGFIEVCDWNFSTDGGLLAELVDYGFPTSLYFSFEIFNWGNFQTSAPSSPSDSRSGKVYALDCEMVYTRRGLSLARVTLVNCRNELVMDILVKPDSPVIDYNSRFSGLTKDLVDEAKYDLKKVGIFIPICMFIITDFIIHN